jgi:hypothetical protein
MRILSAASLLVSVLLAGGCSSPGTSGDAVDAGASPDGATSTIDPSTLGAPCTGGCGEGQSCAIVSKDCPSGLCGVDYRDSAKHWLGCTADCSVSACPTGWQCVDVYGPKDGMRACMVSPAHLAMNVHTSLFGSSSLGVATVTIDASIPADGAANGCGKVEVLADDPTASHLRATLCGVYDAKERTWVLDFAVPKTTGTTHPDMTVVTGAASTTFPVCGGGVTVKTAADTGRRSGTLTGTAEDSCDVGNLKMPLDGTFDLTTLPL